MNPQERFVNAVNEILRHIDFPAVIHSCNSGNQQLAKRVLCQLHCAFVEAYGTDFIKQPSEQFVDVPVVVRGRRNGNLTLGLAVLDMHMAGELTHMVLFTPEGVSEHHCVRHQSFNQRNFLKNFDEFDYWYTPEIAGEKYVNFHFLPSPVYSLLRDSVEAHGSYDWRYAQRILESYGKQPICAICIRLASNLAQTFQESIEKDHRNVSEIDRKLRRKIAEKKQAHGQRIG